MFGSVLLVCYTILTCGIRFLFVRLEVKGVFAFKTLVTVFLISTVGAVVMFFIAATLLKMTTDIDVVGEETDRTVSRIVFHGMVLTTWSLVYLGGVVEMATRKEAARRREALLVAERAELQMLRFQLNPHFIFNSLNNVITEIQERPDVALDMTYRLASYLRYTLEFRGESLAPLAQEVKGMRKYLEIERDRFGEQLKLEVEVADGLDECMIPVFLLQPLIENAVKYGLNTETPPWLISLKIEGIPSEIVINVFSSGEISSDSTEKNGLGVGLDVVRRRLALHYPERSEFSLSSSDGVVLAKIKLEGEPC